MKEINLTFEEFERAEFSLYEGNPVIENFGLSPVVADPSVLTPLESHDGKWHLFCHTFLGVYELSSEDGIKWKRGKRIVPNAMRPDCVYVGGTYYLYYEKTESLVKRGLSLIGGKWRSEIALATSTDLKNWSKPKAIIGKDREYMSGKQGTSISNPFLTEIGGKYRLYFSAGLTYVEDCGFSEPTHISFAESESLSQDFVSREQPIISPDKDSKYLNICSGCIKVYRLKDCYIGLQNGIYKDGEKSHSAIMLLKSEDGEEFEFIRIFLMPTETSGKDKEWMKQYVYACNLVEYGGEMRLYFNARNVSDNLRGREKIGVFRAVIK
ncbi:MAG: glycosyl hydrolase family 43 [Clostridia bacterium]|nr:glycosyl hydrolase family 43 [Clostridia bacterium]